MAVSGWALSSTSANEEKVLVFNQESDEFNQTIVSGGKSDLLLRFVDMIINSFLYDENYGLDSNLSTEIRHGFFSNFIRSVVERHKLITEVDEEGVFEDNSYWPDYYVDLLDVNGKDKLNKALKNFSKNFNELVKEGQSWIKVTVNGLDANAIFNFEVSVYDYNRLKAKADQADSYIELTDKVFEILWSQVDQALVKIKDKINVDFKSQLNLVFQELEEEIEQKIGQGVLSDLNASIRDAKNYTQKIVEEVTEWFSLSDDKEFAAQSLIHIVDLSIQSVEKLRGERLDISKEMDSGVRDLEVENEKVKGLIISLVNIFENCVKHSGMGLQTKIKVFGRRENERLILSVRNGLSDEQYLQNKSAAISRINEKLHSPDSIELMRTEGGSGLAKSFHQMVCIDESFDIAVSEEDGEFITEVSYEI